MIYISKFIEYKRIQILFAQYLKEKWIWKGIYKTRYYVRRDN